MQQQQQGATADWTVVVAHGIRVRPDGADEPMVAWWYDGTTTGGRIIDIATRLAYDEAAACQLIGIPRLVNAYTSTWDAARLFRHHTVVEGPVEGTEVVVHAIAIVTVDHLLSGLTFNVRAEARWLVGLGEVDLAHEDAMFDAADREMGEFLNSIGRPRPGTAAS